jgi:hypothetical protein
MSNAKRLSSPIRFGHYIRQNGLTKALFSSHHDPSWLTPRQRRRWLKKSWGQELPPVEGENT